AFGWVEPIEAVAEGAGRVVWDERVLAAPAGPVGRVEGIQVAQAAVAVGGRAVARRPEAVYRDAAPGELSEDLHEAAVVDPVGVCVHHGDRAGPVRDLQPLRTQCRHPGRVA